jgi:hypothetical protein
MIVERKKLPARAEVSAAEAAGERPKGAESRSRYFVSLTDIAVCIKMRQLSLRAGRWHICCISGRLGGSA